MLDLWNTEAGVKRILPDYVKQEEKLPVYKMPHLEGWAVAGDHIFVPAIGKHEVLVIDKQNWNFAQSHSRTRAACFCHGEARCPANLGEFRDAR